jgi:hypothetical protein
MSWIRLVRRGAAYETGRRLWAWVAAFEAARWTARKILPTALILLTLAVAAGYAARTAAWWLPRLTALAVIAATLSIATWLARRYRWEIRAAVPRTALAAALLALAGILSAAIYTLR